MLPLRAQRWYDLPAGSSRLHGLVPKLQAAGLGSLQAQKVFWQCLFRCTLHLPWFVQLQWAAKLPIQAAQASMIQPSLIWYDMAFTAAGIL